MSGHSKWSKIKHKKAKEDAKRGKAFTKLIKEITIVARQGGGDPTGNPRLRLLLDKAKEINMPQENITRAIKKGTGELPGAQYEAMTYEGYGPAGIAIVVETLTDNKNRTVADLRHIFSAKGGNLAETGAVIWMFEKSGIIHAEGAGITQDDLLETLIEHDIRDIKQDEHWFSIYCDPKSLEEVRKAVAATGLNIDSAELGWVAKTTTSVPQEREEKVYDFLTALEDHEDVQNVYTNIA